MISIADLKERVKKIQTEWAKRIQEASEKIKEKVNGISVKLENGELSGIMVIDEETKYCLNVATGKKALKHYWGVVREGRNSDVPYEKYNPVMSDVRLQCFPCPNLRGVPHKFKYKTISFYYKEGGFTGKSLYCKSIDLSGQISRAYNQSPSPEILEEVEPLIRALERRVKRTLIERRE